MLHLSSERLAELADGEPTIAEAEHLAACAICASERSAHQRLLSLAVDSRDRTAAPLTEWATLSAKLREERIISDDVITPVTIETSVVPIAARPHRRLWLAGLRVAAGLVFAVGFGALGRMSAHAPAVPTRTEVADLAKRVVGEPSLPSPLEKYLDQNSPFSSVEDALATLESSQRNYDRAVAFIAAHDSTCSRPKRATYSALGSRHWTRWRRRRALRSRPRQPIPCSISTTSRRSARVK